jgi:beta-1,4-N-acetylglucosaminyltransferase
MIIVPNTERVDKHQVEIAEYMKENGYALICMDINELQFAVDKIMNTELKVFQKEDFFAHFQIRDMLSTLYAQE